MIKDLAVGFEQAQQQFPSIVQDNYKLKEGIYIRLKVDQTWEEQSTSFDQNHLVMRNKEEVQKSELLDWFKLRDYFCSLVEMNKSVDLKKQVHSNNPFSLFVKREVFLGEKKDAKYTMTENIDRYLLATYDEQVRQKWLELIPNVKKKGGKEDNHKKENQASNGLPDGLEFFQASEYAEALKYLNNPNRLEWIERIAQWYKNNAVQLTDFVAQIPFKNYVKLFFALNPPDAISESFSSEKMYAFEYVLYTIPKIFNCNDFNQIVNEELVGLPSYDMTMNSKKPFLEHKTMRVEAPDRVSLHQAVLAKEAMEWLSTQQKYATNKLGYESGFSPSRGNSPEGTFHVYMDGKYNELFGFENVPFPPALTFNVEWINCLQLKDREGNLKYYGTIVDAEALQKTISAKFFRGRMNGSFVLNNPDVKNKDFTAIMVALFLQSRQAFHDWFYKGTTISLRPIFEKVTLRLIEEQLTHVENSRMADLADAFNLRLSIESLIDEKGGKRNMADRIEKTVASLRNKLSGEGIVICSNDEEFYFTAGQLAFYLMKQSKAEKKTGEIFEPFLRAKNGQQLKKRLEDAYMLYKHEISSNYRRFNHAFSMVMGYVPEQGNEGNARELFLAGIFADNLLFEKTIKGVV